MKTLFIQRDETWMRTAPAADAIGFSPRTLIRRIGDGILVSGVHFIKSGPSKSSWYLFNVPECRKALGSSNGGQG
jgi:hypothetical protein